MSVAPSSIYYTGCSDLETFEGFSKFEDVDEAAKRVSSGGSLPKLQVTEKCGKYFTLNNSQLQIFRRLEEIGVCKKIRVDVVPLTSVPTGIQKMMVASTGMDMGIGTEHQKTTTGYQKVNQAERSPIKSEIIQIEATESENESSEGSYIRESDSDLDWEEDFFCNAADYEFSDVDGSDIEERETLI